MIAAEAVENPRVVLGLATGSSPLSLYAEMHNDVASGKVSYRNAKSWNLDEYVGLSGTHPQSYRQFMEKNLFSKIDIQRRNTHLLNGLATDIEKECVAYESQIKRNGGIDIQVLGIGSDGHIAFNEPGSSLTSRTRVVYLTPQTVNDNSRFFENIDDVPTRALSMGVGTICEARKIILLAFGKAKAKAIAGCVEGPITQFCTASALQMHPNTWVFCDQEAASELKLANYYNWRSNAKLRS